MSAPTPQYALTPEPFQEEHSPVTAPTPQSLQEASERTPKTIQDGFEPPSSAPTPQSAPTPEPFPEAYSPFTAATPQSLQEPDFPLGTFYNQTSTPLLPRSPTPTPLFARSPTPKAYPEASLSDLECCRLSRRLVLRFLKASWFERYIQGMWVRYLVGTGKYRIFRVKGDHSLCSFGIYQLNVVLALSKETVEPYQINETTYNRKVELVCGGVTRNVFLDLILNGAFTEARTKYIAFQSSLTLLPGGIHDLQRAHV
ncbi:hypothetical protein BDP27DRAFT_1418286 [Rhodocollybia butyracea]|uniref:Plus3 domain-containing protein n=1 Tax=Rhodocollybia butyracea TaxID=206335 RepID=A0A9P5PZK9_9AGAR|nr:hypothetical protein BDP27DRAFT_1418286 [Rhodocollybia butyracea]